MMLFIRDNSLVVSDNEAGMETKTVLTYIPLNFCSTYIWICSTYVGNMIKYGYVIAKIIDGKDLVFKKLG